MTTPLAAAVAVLLVSLSACASDGPTVESTDAPTVEPTIEPTSTTVVVVIESSRFSIPALEIAVGDTVRFEQRDPFAHTVTERGDDPTFDSGELAQGDSFEITFDTAGTYEYLCLIHPTMRGTIEVS